MFSWLGRVILGLSSYLVNFKVISGSSHEKLTKANVNIYTIYFCAFRIQIRGRFESYQCQIKEKRPEHRRIPSYMFLRSKSESGPGLTPNGQGDTKENLYLLKRISFFKCISFNLYSPLLIGKSTKDWL